MALGGKVFYMNNERRKNLEKAKALLDDALDIVSDMAAEEQDCLDNMPENLEGSERCSKMEEAVDFLNDAIENIESAVKNIDDATDL